MTGENPYRQLPSVDWLVAQLDSTTYNHARLVEVARQTLGIRPPNDSRRANFPCA